MGKRNMVGGGSGPFKLVEQEITRIGDRIRKLEEQISALRDLTWVAADLLNEYGGKKIKLTLNDGSTMTGVLERYDRFNLRIKKNSKTQVVMKHAIAVIEEV